MFGPIPAFSIVLYNEGAKFSTEEEENRKRAIREEIPILIPATKDLMQSELKESMVIKDNKKFLTYDLVESRQLSLEFGFADPSKMVKWPIVVRLIEDLQRLRDSAESTQIRILELAQISASCIAGGADELGSFLENLSEEDKALWKFIRSKSGQTRRVGFPDADVLFQIPLFPQFSPEKFTRKIRGRIKGIFSNVAVLGYVNELDAISSSAIVKRYPIPKKRVALHRTIYKDKEYLWPLLYAAHHYNVAIEAEVRVALDTDSLKPGYLELVDLINTEELKMKWDLLNDGIRTQLDRK